MLPSPKLVANFDHDSCTCVSRNSTHEHALKLLDEASLKYSDTVMPLALVGVKPMGFA